MRAGDCDDLTWFSIQEFSQHRQLVCRRSAAKGKAEQGCAPAGGFMQRTPDAVGVRALDQIAMCQSYGEKVIRK